MARLILGVVALSVALASAACAPSPGSAPGAPPPGTTPAAPAAQPAGEQPTGKPWTLGIERVKEVVGRVRAGRDLTPKSWPDGARVAVALSFDVDNETGALRDERFSPQLLSQGEYGARTGVPRILALAERHQIPLTFFVPAVSALLHEDSTRSMLASGRHEIGFHSWIHERNSALDETTERDLLARSLDTLQRITGKRPVGMRTASWDYSQATAALAKEAGLIYDSSLMADDRPYEVLIDGKPTGLVQLPVEWILDDAPYFNMDRWSTIRPTMNQEEVFAIWKGEFDVAYEERSLFLLTMHPHISGHRARIAMVDRLIAYIKSKPGVWFATHEAVARYVAAQAGLAVSPAR